MTPRGEAKHVSRAFLVLMVIVLVFVLLIYIVFMKGGTINCIKTIFNASTAILHDLNFTMFAEWQNNLILQFG